MVRLVLLVAALIPLLTSSELRAQPTGSECQADHPDRPALVGIWNWVHTYDTHSGDSTPESAGVTRELHLRDDWSFTFYEDGVEDWSGNWCLRPCSPDIFGNCGGQVVISFAEECGQYPAACEWSFLFCPGAGCSTVGPELVNGLQLRAMDHSDVIRSYEWVGTVGSAGESWSVLKVRY